MTKLEQAVKFMAELSPAERAELLDAVARNPQGPVTGIEVQPDVCGGEACIAGARIPVWLLEQSRRLGMSEAEILRSYPTLRAADLVNAWAYVQRFKEDIDRQIDENEEA